MIDIILNLIEGLFEPLRYFFDGSKRIFWLYLLASMIIYLVALFFSTNPEQKKSLIGIWKKELWLNQSSWVDIQWMSVNQVISFMIIVPLVSGQVSMAMFINRELYGWFGTGNIFQFSPLMTALVFTTVLFLFDDFSRFLLHFCYHKIPMLWRFHAIHHSATSLTPITLYRIHTLEMIINTARSFLVIGTLSGVFVYYFDGSIAQTEIFGASVFNVAFNFAGANLRHSPVWIGFGALERFFISPAQHQIHHSSEKKHFDKNFGSSLAIWDRIFRTWIESKNESVIRFGVFGREGAQKISGQIFGMK